MARLTTTFECRHCGAAYPKWVGRCLSCGEWDCLDEVRKSPKGGASPPPLSQSAGRAKRVGEISADAHARTPTGLAELDRVLGGGLVRGGVTLVGGDPGIGKSTLLLQALASLASRGVKSLYVSGEESEGQTAARARRLGAADVAELYVAAETELESVEKILDELAPDVVVVDSVQTLRASSEPGAAGTVGQLREVAARLVARAKRDGFSAWLVGHVTKDGMLAGPKVLEHVVDTVLSFEGERGHSLRTLRALKNRFGSATEVGVFEMAAEGLREVLSPSALFLAERPRGASGSVVAATSEGSRPLLVEVQALVGSAAPGNARRTTSGVDGARVAMLLAVLERKGGLDVAGLEVFVNVAGGVRVDEPAIDLPIALALASSFKRRPLPDDLVAFGELGLAGEVRAVPRAPDRLVEAATLGFRRAVVPKGVEPRAGIEVVTVRTLADAIELLF
jgi:DNA repair protein RadA/Sms